jgi:hypothetical protein
MTKPNIMFYHDGRHPLIYMYEPPMQVEEYQQAVDELIGTPVQAINFCMGDGRTVLHDTKVGELWGDNQDKWGHAIFRRAHQNAKWLIENGHDPLKIVADRAHEKGFLFYPTLLVQQGSGDPSTDTRGSTFRFTHKHLDIGAAGNVDESFKGFNDADFKHEEIRDERFALIQETLQNYDCDGFELQMNYQPYYFNPNEVEAGIPIMTEWIKRVSDAVKASGSERELVVRMPASVKGCMSVGMDIIDWIDKGLVDVVVAQDFSGPELLTGMSNFRELVEAAEDKDTRILAAIQSNADTDRVAQGTIEMVRAAATNYWAQGVDGLYLAHWFGNWPYRAQFYEKLREIPYPEVMQTKDKIYSLPTISQRYQAPDTEPGLSMQLTRDLHKGKTEPFTMTISDDLAKWHKVGRIHKVLLRMRIMGITELDEVSFKLNGKSLPDSSLRKINALYRMSAPRFRVGSGYWFIYDLGSEYWPTQGDNTLEITHDVVDEVIMEQSLVRDIELDIRYLMGKNYHREFVDDELGPYEISGE